MPAMRYGQPITTINPGTGIAFDAMRLVLPDNVTKNSKMRELLSKFGDAEQDEAVLWTELVDRVRPKRADDIERATENLLSLIRTLRRHPELNANLRESLQCMFHECKVVSLYVSSGLLPSTGFFSETARRISSRMLPEIVDTHYMRGVVRTIFNRPSDEIWVNGIADEHWIELIDTLFGDNRVSGAAGEVTTLPEPVNELVEALRVLSYHVSSIGLDPELVRIDPSLEEHESPFLAQNAALVEYLAHYHSWWSDETTSGEDEKHLVVMLDQCREVVIRIRKRAAKLGTSLSLTFKLERLRQHLLRIGSLLDLLTHLRTQRSITAIAPNIVALFKELIRAECRANDFSDYWSKHMELLSLRMTENASKTGEHYITATRSEYFGIFRSAALGGLIISLMAMLKIVITEQNFAPLNASLLACLNYGIGFAFIHIIGGTVATKQPAMTANAIAASIGEAQDKQLSLDNLVELIARTIRSQIAAIIGNVGVAIPMAMLFGTLIYILSGSQFVTIEKAYHLLGEVNPLSGAGIYAGIAGVCLFLSGLIAGYYDNLCAYGRIPERLLQLRWPRRLFGEARMQRVAAYVGNNLGALAGNFFFGFLLGGVTAIGVLFGLPLDIRHIAFSSAYVGYATVGLGFHVPIGLIMLTMAGVALIGFMNLAVSFTLTLSVAMRSRRISFEQKRELFRLIMRRFILYPRDFLLPPTKEESERIEAVTAEQADEETTLMDEISSTTSVNGKTAG